MDDTEFSELLSDYISQRDRMRATHNNPLFGGANQGTAYLDLLNSKAELLSDQLPALSLAQWEALTELVGSRLATLRRRIESN